LKPKTLINIIFVLILLSSCAPIPNKTVTTVTEEFNEKPTLTQTEAPNDTPTPTSLPTSTNTPLPTIDKHPPTPTVARPVEWDLDPYIEKRVDTMWHGVRIKVNLIVDSSFKDVIHSITIPDSLLAEVAAKAIYGAWFNNTHYMDIIRYFRSNSVSEFNYGSYTQSEKFEEFLRLWQKAQESGEFSDWIKVRLTDIMANNLDDGNGYKQKPYTFLPMHNGEPFGDNLSFDQLSIVLVKGSATEYTSDSIYITPVWKIEGVSTDTGTGTNYTKGNLMVYLSLNSGLEFLSDTIDAPATVFKHNIWRRFSSVGFWLAINNGANPTDFYYGYDEDLFSRLKSLGELDATIKQENIIAP